MNMNKKLAIGLVAIALSIPSLSAFAKTQTVNFARGATSASYEGKVRGYNYNSYVFYAKKGQSLKVTLTGSPNAEAALYGYDDFDSDEAYVLPKTGKYVLRVLQPRAQARKGLSAPYNLKIEIK